jgi:hypothetical protein
MRTVRMIALCLVALSPAVVAAQNPAATYTESFRKGQTRVTEERFLVNLTPDDPNYRERIKDTAGSDRYELTIAPEGPEGDTKITSWRVTLKDLRHPMYENLLMEQQEASADAKNNLWWLNPNHFGLVPIRARRVVKVDGFYVAFQVKDLHFTPPDSPYLDSMSVQFAFANSDPRTGP